MITRDLVNTIKNNQREGFINIIYGPRRVGKTVLLNQLTADANQENEIWFNGDTTETQKVLSNPSEVKLTNLVKDKQIVLVDEAQRIKNIGLSLKILIDKFPQKTYYVTGSSSLMLSRGIQEALTGRNFKYKLYPLSTNELTRNIEDYKKPSLLEDQLIYGGYPYLTHLNRDGDKQEYLESITADYLFKDIFYLKNIDRPDAVKKLAVLLAFQIGKEVSYNELANNLSISVKTVMRYIDLLKKAFVIFELGAFSKNLRNEVVKAKKYYFWDLGIRNGLIGQYQSLDARTDVGQLWENFLAVERKKKNHYQQTNKKYYFWRTYQQAEVDWIEVYQNKISAYEFKWQKKQAKTPKVFQENYHQEVRVINKNNYLDFIV